MQSDPQVTKMTQKFEFIATRTIEKPSMKSSTYYASIDSGGNMKQNLGGKPSPVSDQPMKLLDTDDVDSTVESRMPVGVGIEKDEHYPAESSDNSVTTETVDEVSAVPPKKEKLSEKFRKWHKDELKLYSDSDWSQRSAQSTSSSSPHHSVDERADADWNEASRPNETESGSLLLDFGGGQPSEVAASNEKEGEPSMLSSDGHEALDLTDDMLQRNLVETGRSDEFDMFADPVGSSSKTVDVKDEEQDIDFSQVVERNRLDRGDDRSSDSQIFSTQSPNIDRVEPKIRRSSRKSITEDLSHLHKEIVNADSKNVDLEEPAAEKTPATMDPGDGLDSQPGPVSRDAQQGTISTQPGPISTDAQQGPVVGTRFGGEVTEPQEHAITPEQLHYEDQLQKLARDVDALQQEVDTTVNSRELETTDEIVVETKVTEVKTVLMHLGESGNISVMETTEVKTDTDMKEIKKILERDEVSVSHRSDRKQSDNSSFVPLSPSPSPAGSLRSRTPDRHSPSASLVHSDSVEKLLEADLAVTRDIVGDIRPGTGVDAGLYVAICPYEPETDDVMSLHEGEFLEVLEDTAEDWWLVKKSFDGREGYVPAQYLRDKHADDRMVEEEVAKQMENINVDSSKKIFRYCFLCDNFIIKFKKYTAQRGHV